MKSSDSSKEYALPDTEEDEIALIEWAYFEATTLIRQYGDLLEEVRLYMGVGTSTVGECVSMLEEQLSSWTYCTVDDDDDDDDDDGEDDDGDDDNDNDGEDDDNDDGDEDDCEEDGDDVMIMMMMIGFSGS